MKLTVLSPDREIFSGSAKSVKVPGATGYLEILNNHAPIVSSLTEGEVRIIQKDGNNLTFQIEKGFVEVLRNEVSLLVTEVAS